MIEAATNLGASYAKTAMGIMLGDAWNSMVQPYVLIGVLAVAGLKLRDVMGYLVIIMFWIGIIFGASIWLWGYIF